MPRRDEEPPIRRLRHLGRLDVRERQVPHVGPDERPRRRQLLLHPPAHDGQDGLVGRVQAVEGLEVVEDGAEHERGAECRDCEVGLLPFEEVPGGFFGKCFGGVVTVDGGLGRFGGGYGVPVCFGVGVAGAIAGVGVYDGGEGGGDYLVARLVGIDGEGAGESTTRLTVGAYCFVEVRTPVVPMMAGSRRSFFVSVTLK